MYGSRLDDDTFFERLYSQLFRIQTFGSCDPEGRATKRSAAMSVGKVFVGRFSHGCPPLAISFRQAI